MHTRTLGLREMLLGGVALGLMMSAATAQGTPEREAFFGETHVHTGWSFDAYIFGNTMTGPAEAYAYATGEPIKHPLGYTGAPEPSWHAGQGDRVRRGRGRDRDDRRALLWVSAYTAYP